MEEHLKDYYSFEGALLWERWGENITITAPKLESHERYNDLFPIRLEYTQAETCVCCGSQYHPRSFTLGEEKDGWDDVDPSDDPLWILQEMAEHVYREMRGEEE